jgi:Na+-driven multidrug efflux pump
MGVRGAALATVLSQTASALWALAFLTGPKSALRLRLRHLRLRPAVLGPVAALGVSPFIMQATESLVNISFNTSMLKYGGTTAVGAMTICASVMQVFWLPANGLAQGGQPIISYNFGAGSFDRVKKAFRLLLVCELVYLAALWLTVELFPGALVALFNDEPQLAATARWALRIYMMGMAVFWLQSSCQQTFVALGQAKVSLFFALFRKVLLLIPLIFLLPHFFSDQVFAVLLAEPVADTCSALLCGAVFFYRFPRILARRAEELQQANVK